MNTKLNVILICAAAMMLTSSCAHAPKAAASPATGIPAPLADAPLASMFVFNNRPESGVPPEARHQLPDKEYRPAPKFHEMTSGKIKTVRIRFYNTNSWPTEAQAREYVVNFLAHKTMEAYDSQLWSQGVDVPEVECLVDFTDDYWMKLLTDGKPCREGRLLIWKTESCFRDATGRWWFVNAFDHFHRFHPEGTRNLATETKWR